MKSSILPLALLLALSPLARAADVPEGAKLLVEKLASVRPDLPVERVLTTPMKDVYALELPGGTILHGTADGKYLFAGDMYLLDDALVNVSESARAGKRRNLLEAMPVDDMVVFAPASEPKAAVYVFTDVDCGYCRKLHQEMADINAQGIEVRYLAYPRAGVNSDSYRKIVSAWCATDKQAALTDLKAGREIAPKSCANPVAAQYKLGQEIGISGTPAILSADGQLFPGYMPAEQLAAAIGLK